MARLSLLLALALAALVPAAAPAPAAAATTGSGARSAVALLETLAVKGRAPKTGYDRDRFGSGWIDADRNGCDTRNDILRRDLTQITVKPGTHGCVVLSGVLADPYTRQTIEFVRGASHVDIDHVVALGDAWQKGAQGWPERTRIAFANDGLNLLAVDASANRQKGDGDVATWLPRNTAFRCAYVARAIAVKAKYGAWVTVAERAQMARILASCPGQRAPDAGPAPIVSPNPGPRPAPPRPIPPPTGGAVRYDNCAAARAAGVTPILRGTALYAANTHLDGDDDGIACEG